MPQTQFPPQRLLLGPGPSPVPARVLEALGRPTVGHLDPHFLGLMDEVRAMLQGLFQTANEMTLAVSGTGMAGAECLMVNLVEPGARVLVGVNGVFGGRLVDIAQRCGGEVVTLEKPWGQVFDQDAVIERVKDLKPDVVALVHAETSTGAHQPLERIGKAVRKAGGLFVVDCVTSLGGAPVKVDDWHIDAAYSGTQKCLSCPPGLSPITLSPRAVKHIDNRQAKIPSWYLDLSMVRNYWGAERAYHHTAPVNMLYALHEALVLVHEEGLDARFQRHRDAAAMLWEGLADLGMSRWSDPDHSLPMLNTVVIPDGVDDAVVRSRLLHDYDIEIGGGLGAGKGKVWRIGLMGHGARKPVVTLVLAALREVLAGS